MEYQSEPNRIFCTDAAGKCVAEITNIFLMIPTFFLILIIVALFGSNMINVMLVIGLTSWPSNARMMLH